MSKVAHSQNGCGSSSCACKAASSSSTVKLPGKSATGPKSSVWGIDAPAGTDERSSLILSNGSKYGSTHQNQDFASISRPTHSIADKCDRPGGVCCKDEVGEERKLIDPDVVRDM